jgi:hypothetical protein
MVVITATSTSYGAENFASNPLGIMEKAKPGSSARGLVFVENSQGGSSIGYIRYSHIPVFESDGSIKQSNYWDWKKCESWNDIKCPVKSGFALEGRVVLGTCIDNQELGCIDSFKVFNSFGAGKRVMLVGKVFGAVIDIPEASNLGIPRSSSQPLYQDEEGNYFIVRAGIGISISGQSSTSYKLDVDITPVVRTNNSSLLAPKVENPKENRTGLGVVYVNPSPSDCVATDAGICYKAVVPESEFKYSVSVRVPRAVSGWLRGRVADANFDVQVFNEKSQLITVSAKSVKLPIAGGWVNFTDLPNGFIEKVWPSGGYDPSPSASYFLVADPSQGDRGLEEYTAWSPYLKEKALTTVSNWSFGTNLSGSDQSCLKVPGQISGFVASNASVYSSKPPQWDAATSSLTYRVAAPHLDELGNVNSGNYTLAMPLTSIKCLYGRSNLPPSATVSVAYGNEVTNIATVSLQSDSGWVFFSANNFHYSSPNIVVKFNSAGSTVPPSPSAMTSASPAPVVSQNPSAKPLTDAAPTPSVSPSAMAKPQPSAGKTTIWCAKGYAKRKLTAIKPVCPKGFKKIADPLSR